MLIPCNLSEVLAVGVVPSERRTPKRHKKARKEDIRLVGTYLSFLSWDNKDSGSRLFGDVSVNKN